MNKQLHDSATCTPHNESAAHLLYPVCSKFQTSQATSLYSTVRTTIRSKANTIYNHGWNPLVNLQIVHFVSIAQAAKTEIYEARDGAFALQSPTDIQPMLSFSHDIIYRSVRNFILELFSITQSWYTINQT
jgi:hypothetical protein